MENRNYLNRKGFSLVELMIVVAIIGTLSAIAVPSFQRFRAKAIQAEAKSNLGSYYTAAKATYAEFGFYAGNFVAVGFQPEGELNYRIQVLDNSTAVTNSPTNSACISTDADCGSFTIWSEHPTRAANPSGTEAISDTTFTAVAGADLGASDDGSVIDSWSINERRVISLDNDGLP